MVLQQTKLFTICINLATLSPTRLVIIDKWLLSVFDVEIKSYFQDSKTTLNFDNTEKLIYEWVWRGQQLTNIFLQFANIPAFYTKKEIQFHKDRKLNLNITIPVPYIEQTNAKAYEIAIRSAFEVLRWITNKEIDPQNIQQLYNIVNRKSRIPLKRFFNGGKSTLPILKAAYEKNIPFIHLGSGVYQLGWGRNLHHLSRSTTEFDSAIGARTAQDKIKSALLLKMAGMPTPQHVSVNSKKTACTVASQLGWPVVVKPANCDRGEGVTIGIHNNDQLLDAFDTARKFSKRQPIIIEKEVVGVCHRLFISNSYLLYAIKRSPLSVIGDGLRTVAQLVSDSNKSEKAKAPWLRSNTYPSDSLAKEVMMALDLSLTSIPEKGDFVPLRPFQSDAWGGTFEDVTTNIHSDNTDIAIRAAKVFGLYNAGIDIISPDISQPWHKNNAVINEVNFSPLLGGIDITKYYVPAFLESFINGDGRISIDVFVGGADALESGKERQKELVARNVRSCLTSHDLTLYLSENEITMPDDSLAKRCLALLIDRQVDALVIVVQTNECLYEVLPFDQINSLTKADGLLFSWKDSNQKLPSQTSIAVNRLLEGIMIT